MAVTHDPRVDHDMEAGEGLHDLPDNPPSKLWVLLGPLGCYIGIIKARQAGTSTTFFRRGMYVTGAMVVLWFLLIAAIVAGINRANDALDALEEPSPAVPIAPATSLPDIDYGELVEGIPGQVGEDVRAAIDDGCPLNANYWERPLLSDIPECRSFVAAHPDFQDDARNFGTRELLPEGSLYTVLTVGQERFVRSLAPGMRREILELYPGEFKVYCAETHIYIVRMEGSRSPEPLYDGIEFVSVEVVTARPDTQGLSVTC